MVSLSTAPRAEAWMAAMGRASLWGGLAIGGAWLICRWLPRMSPQVKCGIWRLVYLKLCLLVLAHELAHLQRHDLFWGGLRRLVKAVLFFHPLLWVAHQQAALAEEIACDEAALEVVNAPVADYARTLLRVIEQSLLRPEPTLVVVGAGMSLSYRMMARRLQALPQTRSLSSRLARWRRRRATLLACVALALLLPAGLVMWFRSSGIQQLDPQYRVLGFKVSRGHNHSLSIQREVCTFAGLRLSRVMEEKDRTQADALSARAT